MEYKYHFSNLQGCFVNADSWPLPNMKFLCLFPTFYHFHWAQRAKRLSHWVVRVRTASTTPEASRAPVPSALRLHQEHKSRSTGLSSSPSTSESSLFLPLFQRSTHTHYTQQSSLAVPSTAAHHTTPTRISLHATYDSITLPKPPLRRGALTAPKKTANFIWQLKIWKLFLGH